MPATAPSRFALSDACRGVGAHAVFQPIVDVARGVVAGYESLARFSSAPANPELWFAAARASAREGKLEAAMLRLALAHRAELPSNTFMSVNVSPSSLATSAVRAVWRDHPRLDGIVIEITEHSAIESYLALEPDLNALRSAGALIAVDDAGAGYAGLRHLLHLRPSIIKLDRDLVTDIDIDTAKRALVEMLGTFASRVDAWLLAEGVQRMGELDALAELGVPLAQGFVLGRPGPPWTPINADAAMRLATRHPANKTATLRDCLVVAPAVHDVNGAGLLFGQAGVECVVLVDTHDRPLGLLSPDLHGSGVLQTGMRASVETPLAEAAARAMTRDSIERFAPVLCTDNAGRYVGIVPMESIITALAMAPAMPA